MATKCPSEPSGECQLHLSTLNPFFWWTPGCHCTTFSGDTAGGISLCCCHIFPAFLSTYPLPTRAWTAARKGLPFSHHHIPWAQDMLGMLTLLNQPVLNEGTESTTEPLLLTVGQKERQGMVLVKTGQEVSWEDSTQPGEAV